MTFSFLCRQKRGFRRSSVLKVESKGVGRYRIPILRRRLVWGESKAINALAERFLQYKPSGVQLPARVGFSVSEDGKVFHTVAGAEPEQYGNDEYDCFIDMVVAADLKTRARYVRVKAINAGPWLFVDEVMVTPKAR